MEADICIFRTQPTFDILDAAIRFLDRHPDLPLLHRIGRHRLLAMAGLRGSLRTSSQGLVGQSPVSSHFLVYRMAAFRSVMGAPALDRFHDDGRPG